MAKTVVTHILVALCLVGITTLANAAFGRAVTPANVVWWLAFVGAGWIALILRALGLAVIAARRGGRGRAAEDGASRG